MTPENDHTTTPEHRAAGLAQNRALTQLTHENWDRYQEIYKDERTNGTARRPQSRAKTRLSHENRERYRELYYQELQRLAELPEGEPRAGRRGIWTHTN